MKLVLRTILILVAACSVVAQDAEQQGQAKALALYPELGDSGSEFNRRFLERVKKMRDSNPRFFDNPEWPIRLAEEIAKPPSLIPGLDAARNVRTPEVTLVTSSDVKKHWLNNLKEPSSLDSDYHDARAKVAAQRRAISDGLFDELAEDKANGINIPTLIKAGLPKRAAVLQQARDAYATRQLERGRQQVEAGALRKLKKQGDQQRADAQNQMIMQQHEMERQTRQLEESHAG